MKLWRKYAALAAALVLCLTLAACGGDDGGNGDGGSDDNFYNVPESFEGLVKDSEQMADLCLRRRVARRGRQHADRSPQRKRRRGALRPV